MTQNNLTIFATEMILLRNDSTDPFFNMAFDACCLERLPLGEPVCYLWRNRPSVIIGLNQNIYAEVNLPFLKSRGILLARRVTGGGAVYHDLQNLNYTIVGRSSDIERDYPGYAGIMADALRTLGVNAVLSGRNDILVDGKKVSGYAKRVWKDRLIVHGTLMYDVDTETLAQALSVNGSKFEAKGIASHHSPVTNLKTYLDGIGSVLELKDALEKILGNAHPAEPEEEFLAAVRMLAEEKFSSWEWVYGHSPASSIKRRVKTECGTVEAAMQIEKGVISRLEFTGDFIGDLPSDRVSEALEGCRLEESALRERMKEIPVHRYFDSMTEDGLISLLLS